MILIDLFAWISFICLIYCLLLQAYIASCSSKGRITDIKKRNYTPKFEQDINIIVYSHNNSGNIIGLIDSLKKQDYNPDKYSINVILDNCTDDSAKLLEILGGTKLWRISTDVKPIGRNKAVGWLLERILSTENTNAFAIIDADCVVKPDFLRQINSELVEKPVVIGEVHSVNNENSLITNIVNLKHTLLTRIYKHGRYHGHLHNILEGHVWAIRQDVLEKVNFTVTDYGFEEYEYSIKLSHANIKVATSNQIIVFKDTNESFYSASYEECKRRYKAFITLKNNFADFFSIRKPLRTKELLLSLLYPSGTIVFILVFAILNISLLKLGSFGTTISYKYPLLILFIYMVLNTFQMLIARIKFEEYKTSVTSILITPVIFLYSFIINIKTRFKFNRKLPSTLTDSKDFTKQVINAIVSDGKKELYCKIELKETNNYAQAIFIFREKKLNSSKHLNLNDALKEISDKLKAHGFCLKVCLNCKYAKSDDNIIAKFKGKQIYCIFDNIHKNSKAREYTYIWNSCKDIDTQPETKEDGPKDPESN